MVIYLLTVLTEYSSIALCLHKAADKRVSIKTNSIICVCLYVILLYLFRGSRWFNILLYVFWFIYARIKVADNFKDALKSYSIMAISVPTIQMILYALFASSVNGLINDVDSARVIKIFINILICIGIILWKRRYFYALEIRTKKFHKFVIFSLVVSIFVYVLYVYRNNEVLTSQLADPIILCMVVWGLTILLLQSAELEKKHKIEELKLYEQYTSVFEDALTVIKMKQHEFDNHINAIKCMQYVIDDRDELIKEQQEYCENVIKENIYNKVLLLKIPLILSGYLYSKFTIAEEKGIRVDYMIQEIKEDGRVSMNDLIEVIGILFDNAMEELVSKGRKYMKISIYYDDTDKLIVEIVNESNKILNTEIEKFFENGYSTKGGNRGIGLYRLMDLKRKYRAEVSSDNFERDELFYMRFRVGFKRNKKRSL